MRASSPTGGGSTRCARRVGGGSKRGDRATAEPSARPALWSPGEIRSRRMPSSITRTRVTRTGRARWARARIWGRILTRRRRRRSRLRSRIQPRRLRSLRVPLRQSPPAQAGRRQSRQPRSKLRRSCLLMRLPARLTRARMGGTGTARRNASASSGNPPGARTTSRRRSASSGKPATSVNGFTMAPPVENGSNGRQCSKDWQWPQELLPGISLKWRAGRIKWREGDV
mmetsp:Transcript_47058/g.110857  ORF Transcript_47058/g.110857 Transcript_47058/m.110857 type:complete len:227 (-) Transcript_47058:306-986(-)